jgi:hypothetical protein
VLSSGNDSYLRYPTLHGDLAGFVAQDDVWLPGGRLHVVATAGGPSVRTTWWGDPHARVLGWGRRPPGACGLRGGRAVTSPHFAVSHPGGGTQGFLGFTYSLSDYLVENRLHS